MRFLLLNARSMGGGGLPHPHSSREKKSVSPRSQEVPRKRNSLSPNQLLVPLETNRGIFVEGRRKAPLPCRAQSSLQAGPLRGRLFNSTPGWGLLSGLEGGREHGGLWG